MSCMSLTRILKRSVPKMRKLPSLFCHQGTPFEDEIEASLQ